MMSDRASELVMAFNHLNLAKIREANSDAA